MSEQWAIVELMGHVKIAGRISEEEKFGGKLGRIDVPTNSSCGEASDRFCPACGTCNCPTPEESLDYARCPLHSPVSKHAETPKFVTQFFGASSVYRITFVTEAVARHVAYNVTSYPVSPWDFPKMLPTAKVEPGDELDADYEIN